MLICDCDFEPTELTKFAPFCPIEAGYTDQVPSGLFDIGVSCSSCKYFGSSQSQSSTLADSTGSTSLTFHCHVIEGSICPLGFCRFWSTSSPSDVSLHHYSQPPNSLNLQEVCSSLQNVDLSDSTFTDTLRSLVLKVSTLNTNDEQTSS